MSSLQSMDCQNVEEPIGLFSEESGLTSKLSFTGYFNGFNVELRTPEDMQLHNLGWFGRGTSSRLKSMAPKECPIMRKRQFLKRKEWYKKFSGARVKSKPDLFLQAVEKLTAKIINDRDRRRNKNLVDLVSSDGSCSLSDDDCDRRDIMETPLEITNTDNIAVVVPNSDSEPDDNNSNYFENMKAECCVNQTKLQEKLIFTMQEAFFFMFGYGSLQIVDLYGRLLNVDQAWELFNKTDKKFVYKYVVYHYFRSKGFIVKPGIKFGGDYLLYKHSPELTHSDYIVVIKYKNHNTDWISTLGHVRMANTTVKEILLAEVVFPQIPGDMPESLKNYRVRTTILSRNIGTINEDE